MELVTAFRTSSNSLPALGAALLLSLFPTGGPAQSVAPFPPPTGALDALLALEHARISIFRKAAPSVVILEVELQQEVEDRRVELERGEKDRNSAMTR